MESVRKTSEAEGDVAGYERDEDELPESRRHSRGWRVVALTLFCYFFLSLFVSYRGYGSRTGGPEKGDVTGF